MTELIETIDDIIKFGLQPNLSVPDKYITLEQRLVKIYNLYFDINYQSDNSNYPDYNKSNLPDIRHNVETNFTDFGFYKTVLDYNDIDNLKDCGIGDAIDDLTDIISDLLEIKWRIENNSLADGLWYFELIFKVHTQQHILDLLNYMKQKKCLITINKVIPYAQFCPKTRTNQEKRAAFTERDGIGNRNQKKLFG